MASVGSIALYFALMTTIYAIFTAFWGAKTKQSNYLQSSRGATLSSFLMIVIASFVLIHALITSNFQFAYVADYTSKDLPLIFKISAFWAGQAGSLLLWLFFIAGITLIVQYRKEYREHDADLKYVSLMNLVKLFFLFLLVSLNDPFQTVRNIPPDGMGLNPMLQSFGMVIHPPILFIGFSGFLVPFVIMIIDIWNRYPNPTWAERSRPWVLFSWLMLTAGMITGGNWAYTELGWGGYWAWDPVENASLFPWLTATALLHTLIMQRNHKGMRIWNYLLISITFILTIFGTFLTRSGILDSVHAFSDNGIGRYFMMLIIALCSVTVFLLIVRFPQLKSPQLKMTILSKESGLIFTSILLILICIGVFLGTMFPLISTALLGRKITLDQSFYNQVTIPIWLALAFLMGVCPVLNWKETEGRTFRNMLAIPTLAGILTGVVLTILGMRHWLAIISFAIAVFVIVTVLQDYVRGVAQYWRNSKQNLLTALGRYFVQRKQKYGAYIIHLGVIVMLVGVTGAAFKTEVLRTLTPGEEMTFDAYTLRYEGITPEMKDGYSHVMATLKVYEGEHLRGSLQSTKTFHAKYKQPATEVGILSGVRDDLYFNLAGWEGEKAHLQVSLHPLTSWIWIGSYVLYFGVLVILFPVRRRVAADVQKETT